MREMIRNKDDGYRMFGDDKRLAFINGRFCSATGGRLVLRSGWGLGVGNAVGFCSAVVFAVPLAEGLPFAFAGMGLILGV